MLATCLTLQVDPLPLTLLLRFQYNYIFQLILIPLGAVPLRELY